MAATKTARPANGRARKVKVTPDDFLRIERFLCTRVLLEREHETRVLLRGMLAGVNIHFIGLGGIAKSLLAEEIGKCIAGARVYAKELMPGTPADAVIGSYDLGKLAREGVLGRNLDGYMPKAHIGILDELLRSNGLVRDALLGPLNSSNRRADLNGSMISCDLLTVISTSNTWFERGDPYTQALEDRISVMLLVEDLRADDSFMELIDRDHERRIAMRAGTFEQVRETITLEQFEQAQIEVEAVRPTPEFKQAAAALRQQVKGANLAVSPRRWMDLYRVCRAQAWMAGRDELIPEDLVVVEHGLWREKGEIPNARKLVQPYRGKFEQMAEERRQEAEKAFARVEAIRPQIEGTPLDEEPPQDALVEVIKAMREIRALKKRVETNIGEAEREKRAASELHALANEIEAVEQWAVKQGLPLGTD